MWSRGLDECNYIPSKCRVTRGMDRGIQGLGKKTWGKETTGIPIRILENNIKIDLTEIDCEVVDWMNIIIFLASDSVFQ